MQKHPVRTRQSRFHMRYPLKTLSIQVDAHHEQWMGRTKQGVRPGTADECCGRQECRCRLKLGVGMGLGENGRIAFAHNKHDTKEGDSKKSNFIAGQYRIGWNHDLH